MHAGRNVLTHTLVRAILCCCISIALAAGGAVAAPGDAHVKARLERGGLSLDDVESVVEAGAAAPSATAATASSSRKHPMLAFLRSAVLPGWGELSTGHTARAKAFMSAEAAIWIGYLAFTVQKDMRTDDYEEYAEIFAGVPEGASTGYYGDIADYIRSEGEDSYNEAVRADARSLFPDDLDAQRQYLEENGYFGAEAWDWDDPDRLEAYRDLRHDAGVSRRNAFYMTGLAVLNRAVSAIDSAWMARRHNAGISGAPPARLSIAPDFAGDSVGGRLVLEIDF